MIKAIFFDIDGTLMNKNTKILASIKQAIIKAQAQGILCAVATGRGPVHLSRQIDELNFDIFVTYNGQFVYTKEKTIRAEHFTDEVLKRIVSFSDSYHRQIMFGSRNNIEGSSLMRFGQKKWAKKIVRFLPKYFPVKFANNLISRFSIHRKPQRYHDLDILNEQLPDCQLTRSNPYTLDILPKGGSKLVGIQKCAEYFGFTLDEVMAFGDSWNDLEMLSGIGFGVAMGNAEDEVKNVAKYVTSTNDEDGIYNALVHYDVI